MAQALARSAGRVVVVAAPGGHGKTAQIAAWVAADGRAAAWIDLEAGDDEPTRLLAAMVHALRAVTDAAVDGLAPGVVRGHLSAVVDPAELGHALAASTTPFILVFDGVEHLSSAASFELLEAVLLHVPAASTVVVIGRSLLVGAPLARLRASGSLIEIGASHLTLSLDETRRLLRTMGAPSSRVDPPVLWRETEGWVVGVRLAASAAATLASSQHRDPVRTLSHDIDLAEYVREEWLHRVAPPDVRFLTDVATLDRLLVPLCNHLVRRDDAGSVLRRLHREHLIVEPLERRVDTYRMHRLLTAVLRDELVVAEPARARALHHRAVDWLLAHGDIDGAVEHLIRCEDWDRVVELVAAHGSVFESNGHGDMVQRWLARLPEDVVRTSPDLAMVAALDELRSGNGAASNAWYGYAERALAAAGRGVADDGTRMAALQAGVWNAYVLDQSTAGLAAAEGAAGVFADSSWRTLTVEVIGALSYMAGGDAGRALEALEAGIGEADVASLHTMGARMRAQAAFIQAQRGDWVKARMLSRSARALFVEHGLADVATAFLVPAVCAWVEAKDLHHDQARADLQVARGMLQRVGTIARGTNAEAGVAMARACLLLGDQPGAQRCTDEAAAHAAAVPTLQRVAQLIEETRRHIDEFVVDGTAGLYSLTASELRVLQYLPTNLTVAEIAARLYVSRNTAKSHAASIYRKLGTNSRGEAVDLARAAGLIEQVDLPVRD